MASEIATAYIRIAPTATGIQGQLEEILGKEGTAAGQKSGSNFASSFSSATRNAAASLAPVSNAAQGLLSDIITTAADFDAQMSRVQAISGAYGEDLQKIRDLAQEMGRTTKFSASESASALEYMGMAGWKADQMIEGLPGILNLAAAAGEDLGTTSDIVTDALTAFGLGAEDAGRMADIMASTATNSNTNVSMMGETFKYAAGLGGSLKFTMEDVAVAMGLMANSGTKSSQAGTSLRGIMQRLAKPTKESAEAMKQLGIDLDDGKGHMYSFREIMNQMRSSLGSLKYDQDAYNQGVEELNKQLEGGVITQEEYDESLEGLAENTLKSADALKAQYAAMLSGSWGLSGLLAIVNATDEDYQKLCDAVDHSSDVMVKTTEGAVIPLSEALAEGIEYTEQFNGTAEAMSSIMQDNLNGKVTEMKSRFESLKIELGEKLLPILEKLVDWVSGIIDWFSGLDEGTQNLIVGIVTVTAVASPLLNVVSGIAGGISSIIKFGSNLVSKTVPSVSKGLGDMTTAAGGTSSALSGVATGLLAIFDAAMVTYDIRNLAEAAETYQEAADAHQQETANALDNYTKLYNEKGKEIADQWAAAVYQVDTSNLSMEQSMEALTQKIDGYWEDVPENMFEGFAQGWDNYFGENGKGLWQLLDDAGNGVLNFFKDIFGINSPSTEFAEIGENLVLGLEQGVIAEENSLANVLASVGSHIPAVFEAQENNMRVVGWNLMIGLANGIYAGQASVIQAVIAVASAALRTMRTTMGVNSPSTVFESIGTSLIDGLELGLANGEDRILQQVRGITSDITTVANVTAAPAPAPQTSVSQQAPRDLTVILELDRTQFGKAVYRINNEETQRVGVRLAAGGIA